MSAPAPQAPNLPDVDFLSRLKLHGQRPKNGNGPYESTVVGDVTITASFDQAKLVTLAINDHRAGPGGGGFVVGDVLAVLSAREAFALAHELEVAARIADETIGQDDTDSAPF
jgi:hypothetical protein